MADREQRPQVSPSRESLRRFMASRDGIVRGMKEGTDPQHAGGTAILPGSMEYPRCECPKCDKPGA